MLPEYNAIEEFQTHGEYQLLEKLVPVGFNTILDVGCNRGYWTQMARSFHQNAHIHMFEISTRTYRHMLQEQTLDDKMVPNNFGLSNSFREIPVKYVPHNDRVTTTISDIRHDDSVWTTGVVLPGDVYLKMHDISYVDYLKIDTEGHEYEVLQGFENILTKGHVAVIQFEYSFMNVLTKNLLIDFYKMLNPLGYVWGKISPDGIEFKEYHLWDEDFHGPDYIAVHKSRPDIMSLIKK